MRYGVRRMEVHGEGSSIGRAAVCTTEGSSVGSNPPLPHPQDPADIRNRMRSHHLAIGRGMSGKGDLIALRVGHMAMIQ